MIKVNLRRGLQTLGPQKARQMSYEDYQLEEKIREAEKSGFKQKQTFKELWAEPPLWLISIGLILGLLLVLIGFKI